MADALRCNSVAFLHASLGSRNRRKPNRIRTHSHSWHRRNARLRALWITQRRQYVTWSRPWSPVVARSRTDIRKRKWNAVVYRAGARKVRDVDILLPVYLLRQKHNATQRPCVNFIPYMKQVLGCRHARYSKKQPAPDYAPRIRNAVWTCGLANGVIGRKWAALWPKIAPPAKRRRASRKRIAESVDSAERCIADFAMLVRQRDLNIPFWRVRPVAAVLTLATAATDAHAVSVSAHAPHSAPTTTQRSWSWKYRAYNADALAMLPPPVIQS